jgi:RNA polymerase sigma factor (sigma-70 family)
LAATQLKNRCLADDILGETHLEVVQSSARFDGQTERELRAWVFGIARNKAKRIWRDDGRRRRREEAWGVRNPEGASITSDIPSMDELLERQERWDVLVTALPELDPDDLAAVLLRHVRGYSLARVAACLRLPQRSTKKHLSRGLKELRACSGRPGTGFRRDFVSGREPRSQRSVPSGPRPSSLRWLATPGTST